MEVFGGGPSPGVGVVDQLSVGASFVKILCVLCVGVCILILRGGGLVGQLLLRLSSQLHLFLLEVGICLLHHLFVCCSLGGGETGNKRRECCCNCLQFCAYIA